MWTAFTNRIFLPYETLNAKILGEPGEHRVSQVIRARPFQIIDRRDQSRFQPAAFLHLRGRQSFAPLTAASLGQVIERGRSRFRALGSLEDGNS